MHNVKVGRTTVVKAILSAAVMMALIDIDAIVRAGSRSGGELSS
jgi:hypothetical protein